MRATASARDRGRTPRAWWWRRTSTTCTRRANINKQTALTEKGEVVSGRGDTVNMHDILTGSDPEGMYSTAGGDTTCGNWTKSGEGSAIVGHHDRVGLKETRHMKSWNSSHGSRGCSQERSRHRRRRPALLLRAHHETRNADAFLCPRRLFHGPPHRDGGGRREIRTEAHGPVEGRAEDLRVPEDPSAGPRARAQARRRLAAHREHRASCRSSASASAFGPPTR